MGELFEVLDLGEWADKPLKDLSGGVARLVLFCAAVVAPGSLVILDEPTNDVDPHRRRALWGLVRDVADDGAAVVLVTHSVAEAERAVDRIAIMDAGRIVAEGSLAAMRRDEGWLQLSISLDGTEQPEPPPFLQQLRMLGRRLLARVAEEDLSLALQWAQELRRSGTAEEFSIGPSSLEDTYERLVPTAVGTPA
jgi:ABC-2 type transport system ATP-binding protein